MLVNLDNDTFGLICEFLTVKDVGRLTCSSKAMKRKIWKHDFIWFNLYVRAYHNTREGHTNSHFGPYSHECFLTFNLAKKTYSFNNQTWRFIKQAKISNDVGNWVTVHNGPYGPLQDYPPLVYPYKIKSADDFRKQLSSSDFSNDAEALSANILIVDEVARRSRKCVNITHKHKHKIEFKKNVDYKKKYKKLLAKQYSKKKISGDLKSRVNNINEKIKKLEQEREELLRTARMIEFAKKYNK